jgi:cation:H+ antiporter
MVVCGFCALFCPLLVDKGTLKKEFPFSVACAALLIVLGYFGMELGRVDGIIFLVLFVGFLAWMIHSARAARAGAADEDDEEYRILPVWRCIVYIVGGIIAIKFGGDFVVDGASAIAAKMGLSQNLIGLTVVALGTSLPELVTSAVAARKNELDMALGNVIGSNVFNILLVLGIAAAISPVAFIMENIIDIAILIAMSAIVWIFAWTKQRIDKKEGIIMLLLYAVYLVYICMR